MRYRTKRERWAREAIAITDVLTKDGAGRYLCPLCLEWYADLDELTLEHAPPKSVGGRHIAVTCRDCNSRGGHSVDHELRRAETVLEFAERRMMRPMAATIRFGELEQRGEAMFGPDGLQLAGIRKQNHPANTEAITAALDEAAASGSTDWTIGLSFRAPDRRKASIAWLRAGYLVAFATLGYAYILLEAFDSVRAQIHAPQDKILDRYCLMTQSSRADRLISLVEQPPDLACVAVLASNAVVLLPHGGSPDTYERFAAAEPWPPKELTLTLEKTGPWPAEPRYVIDHAALERTT